MPGVSYWLRCGVAVFVSYGESMRQRLLPAGDPRRIRMDVRNHHRDDRQQTPEHHHQDDVLVSVRLQKRAGQRARRQRQHYDRTPPELRLLVAVCRSVCDAATLLPTPVR